eukprot:417608_1
MSLQNWLKAEDYDWDSLLLDFEENQSNIYTFFKQYNKDELFELIHEKYIDNIYTTNNQDIANNNVNAINFGVSVLTWFEYGDKPNHQTFIDEILNNKYSSITKEILQRYTDECEIMLNSCET